MEKDIVDIEEKKLEEKLKNISKVTNRYMRIRLKRKLRKLFGITLK